jgi:ABC-2 type transport system ATP-binding protein
MTEAVLEIVNASRSFADRTALHEVSLEVGPGEIVALLGPNGAGKTSLMRAATGRLLLDGGIVRIDGLNPAVDKAARHKLGIVPQTIALYEHLTAAENLDVFGRLMGLKGDALDSAADLALQRAGLADRRSSLLTELSGGMQRRLNIVAGTLHEPALLLLDEPTVGVDISARERIHELLRELRNTGMAILFSTHDFEQAASVADRAAFMREGRILVSGQTRELVRSIFGDNKELVISLAHAQQACTEILAREYSLKSSADGMNWSGPVSASLAELPQIEARLEEAGLDVTELRIREPGLDSVYLHLANGGSAA